MLSFRYICKRYYKYVKNMLVNMTLSTMESNEPVFLFQPKGFRSPVADLFLAGNRFLDVKSHRYLRVLLEVGKCELDIKRQLNMKFYANANILIKSIW